MPFPSPHVLIVNPWIHDFAAYDFWAKPMGLLLLGAVLRRCDITVTYMDCLDRFHPNAFPSTLKYRFGRGPYLKKWVPRPEGLEDVQRRYSRYGILPEWFRQDLACIPLPDMILVTSGMTYWWPGVRETISCIKEAFPEIPILLGGTYATLCPEHAHRFCGADRVLAGPGERLIMDLAGEVTGLNQEALRARSGFDPDSMDTWPPPAFDLQRKIPYVTLLTSIGCPFSCSYCASSFLTPKRMRQSPDRVVEDIEFWKRVYGVMDYVIYDDAFLVDGERHAFPILEKVIRKGVRVRFHTPNALHIREIDRTAARLLKEAGFETIRLGLETAQPHSRMRLDRKATLPEFFRAAIHLLEAGFHKDALGAYLLVGLPGQDLSEVRASIETVKKAGFRPIPTYYSPIPRTALWKEAVAASRYPMEGDPVFTNNAIMPCQKAPFSWEEWSSIKNLCQFR